MIGRFSPSDFTDPKFVALELYGPDDRHQVHIEAARQVRIGVLGQVDDVSLALEKSAMSTRPPCIVLPHGDWRRERRCGRFG